MPPVFFPRPTPASPDAVPSTDQQRDDGRELAQAAAGGGREALSAAAEVVSSLIRETNHGLFNGNDEKKVREILGAAKESGQLADVDLAMRLRTGKSLEQFIRDEFGGKDEKEFLDLALGYSTQRQAEALREAVNKGNAKEIEGLLLQAHEAGKLGELADAYDKLQGSTGIEHDLEEARRYGRVSGVEKDGFMSALGRVDAEYVAESIRGIVNEIRNPLTNSGAPTREENIERLQNILGSMNREQRDQINALLAQGEKPVSIEGMLTDMLYNGKIKAEDFHGLMGRENGPSAVESTLAKLLDDRKITPEQHQKLLGGTNEEISGLLTELLYKRSINPQQYAELSSPRPVEQPAPVASTVPENEPDPAPQQPVAPVAPESAPAQEQTVEYRVQKGDTLHQIARRNGMSLDDLLALNPHLADRPDLLHYEGNGPRTRVNLPAALAQN